MYFGIFESAKDVANEFGINISVVESVKMIAAKYTWEDYEGNVLVLFEKDGVLFRIEGGHCALVCRRRTAGPLNPNGNPRKSRSCISMTG
jgi:hypothetical protein